MAQIINIAEVPTGYEPWYYTEKDGSWKFESYSPAGENLVIEGELDWFANDVWGGLARYLMDIYRDFDPEEHAVMWYGANNGEPESIEDLIGDAYVIEEMYFALANHVNDLAYGKR